MKVVEIVYGVRLGFESTIPKIVGLSCQRGHDIYCTWYIKLLNTKEVKIFCDSVICSSLYNCKAQSVASCSLHFKIFQDSQFVATMKIEFEADCDEEYRLFTHFSKVCVTERMRLEDFMVIGDHLVFVQEKEGLRIRLFRDTAKYHELSLPATS